MTYSDLERHHPDAPMGRPGYKELCLLLAVAALLLLAAAGPEAYSRYRVPAMPMIAIAASYGWVALRRHAPSIRQGPQTGLPSKKILAYPDRYSRLHDGDPSNKTE